MHCVKRRKKGNNSLDNIDITHLIGENEPVKVITRNNVTSIPIDPDTLGWIIYYNSKNIKWLGEIELLSSIVIYIQMLTFAH